VRSSYRFAIVGAGLAGLSLARAFARGGTSGPIAIVDAKRAFVDDRTWSFWDVDGCDDVRLASGAWHRWELVDDSGSYVQQSSRSPYVAIKSRDFYADALAAVGEAGYDVLLGEPVTAIVEARDSCTIALQTRSIVADYVFDARGLTAAMAGASAVRQCFVGQRIEVAGDAFDPATATLMDVNAIPATASTSFTSSHSVHARLWSRTRTSRGARYRARGSRRNSRHTSSDASATCGRSRAIARRERFR